MPHRQTHQTRRHTNEFESISLHYATRFPTVRPFSKEKTDFHTSQHYIDMDMDRYRVISVYIHIGVFVCVLNCGIKYFRVFYRSEMLPFRDCLVFFFGLFFFCLPVFLVHFSSLSVSITYRGRVCQWNFCIRCSRCCFFIRLFNDCNGFMLYCAARDSFG